MIEYIKHASENIRGVKYTNAVKFIKYAKTRQIRQKNNDRVIRMFSEMCFKQ